MPDWFSRDRGLPSDVDVARVARKLQHARLPRVASLGAALAQGFEPVYGHAGIYRKAHALWAIRQAEDGEGYVVLRLRDEPAPGIEPRTATTVTVSVDIEDEPEPEPEPEAEVALVLEEDPDLMHGLEHGAIVLARRVAQQDPASYKQTTPPSLRHETDIGTLVEVRKPFSPILYSEALVIPKDRLFEVDGYHPADPMSDRIADPGISNPVYPEGPDAGQQGSEYMRIRLKDTESGVIISVLPLEFERYLDPRGQFPKKPVKHRNRGKPRPRPRARPAIQGPAGIGPDTDVDNIGDLATTDIDLNDPGRAPTVMRV